MANDVVLRTEQFGLGITGKLDVMITEGTNIRAVQRGAGRTLRDEDMIRFEAEKIMQGHAGTVFVLCSSTNEARIRAVNTACAQAGRVSCQDLFTAVVRGELSKEDVCAHQYFVANRVDSEKTPRQYYYFEKYFEQRRVFDVDEQIKFFKY